jgi:hypothetical protein
MIVSEKRLAANRANALKSTGAKTPQGKLNSARKVKDHHTLARVVLVEGESHSYFDRLLEELEAQFQPATFIEQDLVETMAVSRWRMRRGWAVESAAINHQQRTQPEADVCETNATRTMRAMRQLGENGGYLDALDRHETHLDREFHRALNRLLLIRAERNRENKVILPSDPTQPQDNKGSLQ